MPAKYTFEQVKKIFEEGTGCKLLSNKYKSSRHKLDYICNCGTKAQITLYHFQNGTRCRKCANKKIAHKLKFTYDKVKKIFEKQGCYLISKIYKNSFQKLDYICNCGTKTTTTLNIFQDGHKCQQCRIIKMSGHNNCNYNPNLTDEERQDKRKYPEYHQWRQQVFERDNYTCQYSLKKGGPLHSHHIFSYSTHKELRTNINNGITLCAKYHKLFHHLYGNKNNTRQQLEEFLQTHKNSSIISVAS